MATPPPEDPVLAQLAPDARELLDGFLDELLSGNERINLTALRDRDEARERHIVESVRIARLLATPPPALLDVGTGGGLPGMVLAIIHPTCQVTLLEATEKKVRFLEETARHLGLGNVRVVCDRAEQAAALGSPLREHFDVVTARAVAALPTLLELTLPFLRVGGLFLAVKGHKASDELKTAEKALSLLGGQFEESIRQPSATVLLIRKARPCPKKYPRRAGEPKRNPL